MNPYIYLRALKHAEHTVFCVEDGQKTYYDPLFNRTVAYSSGQQVKRSILQELADIMGVQMAPVTFNYNITAKRELENKEPWSPCNPNYVDQLLGVGCEPEMALLKSEEVHSLYRQCAHFILFLPELRRKT